MHSHQRLWSIRHVWDIYFCTSNLDADALWRDSLESHGLNSPFLNLCFLRHIIRPRLDNARIFIIVSSPQKLTLTSLRLATSSTLILLISWGFIDEKQALLGLLYVQLGRRQLNATLFNKIRGSFDHIKIFVDQSCLIDIDHGA